MSDRIHIFGTGSGECVAATINESQFDIGSQCNGLQGSVRKLMVATPDENLSFVLEVPRRCVEMQSDSDSILCPWKTTLKMFVICMTTGMNFYRQWRHPQMNDFRSSESVFRDWGKKGYPPDSVIGYTLPRDQMTAKIFSQFPRVIESANAPLELVIATDRIRFEVWNLFIEESIQNGWNAERHHEICSS